MNWRQLIPGKDSKINNVKFVQSHRPTAKAFRLYLILFVFN